MCAVNDIVMAFWNCCDVISVSACLRVPSCFDNAAVGLLQLDVRGPAAAAVNTPTVTADAQPSM